MKNKEFEMKRSEVNRDSREVGSPRMMATKELWWVKILAVALGFQFLIIYISQNQKRKHEK